MVLKYILSDQVTSSKQLKAAAKYAGANKELEVASFEKECGIGVVVSEAELRAAVQKSLEANAAIVAERKWNAQGVLMKDVSQAFAFADGNLVKQLVTQALEAKLGPQQQGEDGKKDKKGAAPEAKAVEADVVVEKPTTPFVAMRVHEAANAIGKRVLIKGWVHELRVQSKMVFLVVRDAGSGFIQCLLSGKLAKTKDAQNLKRESSVFIYGTVARVPEGQTAENGIEVQADFMEVVGVAMGDVEQAVNKDCSDEIKVGRRGGVWRHVFLLTCVSVGPAAFAASRPPHGRVPASALAGDALHAAALYGGALL